MRNKYNTGILTAMTLALALPLSGPAAAQSQPVGSFMLVTQFLENEDKCFDGGEPLGMASQTDCATATAPRWRAEPVTGEPQANLFQLVSADSPGQCLEGARGEMDDHHNGGVAHLDHCGRYTGQYWYVADTNGEHFRLRNVYADQHSSVNGERCLEGNRVDPNSVLQGASFMDTCQNVSGQFFRIVDGSLVDGIPTPSATPEIPRLTALQSCSVNDAVCETSTTRGYYIIANEADGNRARIEIYEPDAAKPVLTVEQIQLADGSEAVAFQNENGHYLTISGDDGYTASFTADSASDPQSQFTSVQALDSPNAGFASFRSVAFPTRFLRHQGFDLFAHESDDSTLFNRDASWRVLPENSRAN